MKREFLDGYETYDGQRGNPQDCRDRRPPAPSRLRERGRAISFDEE